MKRNIMLSLLILSLMMMSCLSQRERPAYPETRKGDVVDEYFGHKVADPYRWLEDDRSEETAEWVRAQNEVTFGYLHAIEGRKAIKDRLMEIWDYPKVGTPWKSGGRWFVMKNSGLQNQYVVYLLEDYDDREGEVLLDPNKLSEDGTVSLAGLRVSEDGKYLGYSISRGGSDWNEVFVMDIASRTLLDDHIRWMKFSGITWYKNGFFYSRYPEPKEGDALKGVNENSRVYYHKIGTPQEKDVLIYKDDMHPLWGFSVGLTEDKAYMILYTSESTSGNAVAFRKTSTRRAQFTPIVEGFDHDFSVLDMIDGKFYVLTNEGAPNYRLVAIDPRKPGKAHWKEIIPEKEVVLRGVQLTGGKMFASYMKDAYSKIEVYEYDGTYLYDVKVAIGSVGGFGGKKEDNITFYRYTSYTTPSIIYKYDVAKNESEEFDRSAIQFDSDAYETRQVFYTSKDGTRVPMFITHKKGLKMNGTHPTLLYGYGGFNVSLTPGFRISAIPLLENGGIFVVANLRGGGEYGEEWHKAGTLMNKQHVFDDFIAAAEYLIAEKYTSPERLAIQGGSNGGLLIGAVTNQRPDLFAVALPAVGVMDMLRYHNFTIGRYWATDYGTSEDSEAMFNYLMSYSPLHTVKEEVEYPAVLVTTADHDDRVVPAHSFKYIATLQDTYKGANPVMIRIETKAGHGAGKPTEKIIEEIADQYAFIFDNMGIEPYDR
ncbi:MAG: S9 family peptidase [Bacteroidetes bacterium]|nr:MAG: S9 family peptidase [Bacteroidota bacterium]